MMDANRELKAMRQSDGFTLVEVMVVVAIIAVMGLFAAPEIMNFRPSMYLNSAARDLYGSLQNCKLSAVRHNMNCAMTFNQKIGTDTFSYYLFLDSDKDFVPDVGETVIGGVLFSDEERYKGISFDVTKEGGDGLSFTENSLNNPAIGFQANGLPVAVGGLPNGTAYLKNSKSVSKSVVVSKSGNISIKDN